MKKYIIFLFIVLFSLTLVSAVPPFINVASFEQEGLELVINQQNFLPIGENYTLRLHTFNISTGAIIDNTSTTCTLHLNKPNGDEALFEDFSYNITDDEFHLFIDEGNFTTTGEYSWIIYCQYDAGGTVYGGFVEGLLAINPSGYELKEGNSNLINSSLYFFMILSVLSFVAFFFSSNEKMQVKWTLFIVGVIFSLIAINLISLGLSDALINSKVVTFFDNITGISFIMFYGLAFLLGVLWILAFFNTILSRKRKLNEDNFGRNF